MTNALIVAQEHGVVHRDIKPSNLMITGRLPEEFTVKVIDFGLAKLGAPDTIASEVTVGSDRTGFVGTAHFASPEQLENRPVDVRSDIYSLGVTLYFMLSGRPLFEGSMARVVMQHLMQRPPLERISGLPKSVALLLEQMLAKDVESRPASARELRNGIRSCLEATRPRPAPPEPARIIPPREAAPPASVASDHSSRLAALGEPVAPAASAAAKDEVASSAVQNPHAVPHLRCRLTAAATTGFGTSTAPNSKTAEPVAILPYYGGRAAPGVAHRGDRSVFSPLGKRLIGRDRPAPRRSSRVWTLNPIRNSKRRHATRTISRTRRRNSRSRCIIARSTGS